MRTRPSASCRAREDTHVLCRGNTVSYRTELLPLGKSNISSEGVLIFIDMSSSWLSWLVKIGLLSHGHQGRNLEVTFDSPFSFHIHHMSLS